MKCYENLNLLHFKFWIRLQSFTRKMENRNIFVEAKTLDDQERHLTIEMPISRKAHADREREKTPTKKHQVKAWATKV
jgi:hypothetical protein